jgi:xylulokinase
MLSRLTGRVVYDWSTASVTGLFNLKTKRWDTNIMRLFGLHPEKFPELVRSIDRVGGLQAGAADELGLLAGLPVFAGAGDAMTSAVGSGAVGECDGHLSLGTSGYIGISTVRRIVGQRGIVSLQSAEPKKLLLVAETETAGACLKWAARELYCADADAETLAQMDAEVAHTPPGAGGMIFTPWMYGERCPVADDSLRAAFINLGSNHTRSQMTRAIYEGVAYNFRWILESIAELYKIRPDPLRVTGGGARGLPWLQIIADVTGSTLESVADPQETTAVGAALIAAIGLGIYPSFDSIKPQIQVRQVVKPQPGPNPVYERAYPAYRQVYHALKRLYRQLNRPEISGSTSG